MSETTAGLSASGPSREGPLAEQLAKSLDQSLAQVEQGSLPSSIVTCATQLLLGISAAFSDTSVEEVPQRALGHAQELGRLFRKENYQLGDVFRTTVALRKVAHQALLADANPTVDGRSDHQERLDRWFEDVVFAAVNTYYEAQRSELQKRIVVDGLTGVFNRAYFGERLAEEVERARRYSHPVSLLMIDLDSLKPINDRFGHRAGDAVLKSVSRVLRSQSRSVDVVARYGGDEFAVILPQTGPEGGWVLAERVTRAVRDSQVDEMRGVVSISVGIASFPRDADSPEELIDAADKALYRSKSEGGNTVAVFGSAAVTEITERASGREARESAPELRTLREVPRAEGGIVSAERSRQLERQNLELMISLGLAKRKLAFYERLESTVQEIVDGSLRAAAEMGNLIDRPSTTGDGLESQRDLLAQEVERLRGESEALRAALAGERTEAEQQLAEIRARIDAAKLEELEAQCRRGELLEEIAALEQRRDQVRGQVAEVFKRVADLSSALNETELST